MARGGLTLMSEVRTSGEQAHTSPNTSCCVWSRFHLVEKKPLMDVESSVCSSYCAAPTAQGVLADNRVRTCWEHVTEPRASGHGEHGASRDPTRRNSRGTSRAELAARAQLGVQPELLINRALKASRQENVRIRRGDPCRAGNWKRQRK